MNRLNFNQSTGFPLETEILDEMQKSWSVFNFLGDIVGNFTIISGCVVSGSVVSDGCVYINGEVLPFKGGNIQTTVFIKQDVQALEFEDGNTNDIIFTRYVKFGTATIDQYNWADFKRGMQTKDIQAALDLKANLSLLTAITTRLDELEKKNAVFQGGKGWVLWGRPASEIPTGWAEVEEMRGRAPFGLDTTQTEFNPVGKTGGSKTAALTAANNGPHKHGGVPFKTGPGHPDAGGLSANFDLNTYGETELQGEGEPFSILNPHRIVMFIKYVG